MKKSTTSSVKDITDKLEQGLKELFDSDKYKKYLTAMAKFHNYSFNNTLLIAMQMPEASLIAGYNTWKNDFERIVKKGEKGIKIIAPSPYKKEIEKESFDDAGNRYTEIIEIKIPAFKPVTVFDISQTEGKDVPVLGLDSLTFGVNDYASFISGLSKISPVPIEYQNIPIGSKGYFSPTRHRIVIQQGLSESQTLKTLIHEIAHSLLHDSSGKKTECKDDKKNRSTKEVEAESIAYTVCKHFEIDTSEYSFGYIAGWSSDKDLSELKSSMEIIRSTSSQIITTLEHELSIMQKGA